MSCIVVWPTYVGAEAVVTHPISRVFLELKKIVIYFNERTNFPL